MATDAPTGADVAPDDLRRHREGAERLAVAVVQELAARGDTGITAHLVTEGAQPAGDGDVASVAGGTLWGLARVFALEHPDIWGVAVDLEPDAHADGAALAACLFASDEDEQALRGGERWASRLVPKPLETRELARTVELRPDATYLVTGGLGGIGLALSSWLATAGAGRLVLTGRSGLPDREQWDDAELPEATRQRIADVRAIESLGARVDVVGVDVTDADAMGSLVAELAAGDAPLRGVVHAAGVSDPQFVRDVTDEVYERVWRPKVVGGWVLHTLTRDLDLDFYLSFSSIASTWGSQHLASYAAANAFLDGLAYHRTKRGATALTANWGPWETASGLFGDDVMAFLKSVGLRPLRADQCLTLLGSLLAGDAPQAVVCAADWRQYKQVMEAKRERPMLRGIEIADDVASDGAPSAVLDEVLGSEPDEQHAVIDRYVREQLSLILQLDISELQGEFHLLEVGLDSLMVMELISRCRKDLAIKFESRDFFATDANDWAAWLLDLVRDQHDSAETAAAA